MSSIRLSGTPRVATRVLGAVAGSGVAIGGEPVDINPEQNSAAGQPIYEAGQLYNDSKVPGRRVRDALDNLANGGASEAIVTTERKGTAPAIGDASLMIRYGDTASWSTSNHYVKTYEALTANQGDAIRLALASIPNGGSLWLENGVTYEIDGPIDIDLTKSITFKSPARASFNPSTRLIFSNVTDYCIRLRDAGSITLENFLVIVPVGFTGGDPAHLGQGGAITAGRGTAGADTQFITLNSVWVIGADQVSPEFTGFNFPSSINTKLTQCLANYCGRGFYATNGPIVLDSCQWGNCKYWGVDVNVLNLTVIGNNFEPNLNGLLHGLHAFNCNNVCISGGSVFNDAGPTAQEHWIVLENNFSTDIEGNTFQSEGSKPAILVKSSNGLTVDGNDFTACLAGIVEYSSDTTGGVPSNHRIGVNGYVGSTALVNVVVGTTVSGLSVDGYYGDGYPYDQRRYIDLLIANRGIVGTVTDLPLVNGDNTAISPTTTNMRIVGTTADFALVGMTAVIGAGQLLCIEYDGVYGMKIVHNGGATGGAIPFLTSTGQDLVFPKNSNGSVIRVWVCAIAGAWHVMTSPFVTSELTWGSNNDNGAAVGWPIFNGNPISTAQNGNEVAAQVRVKAGSVIRNLMATTYTNADNGGYVITVRVNGVDTALTCTIAAGAKTAQDLTHPIYCTDSGDGYCTLSVRKSAGGVSGNSYGLVIRATLESLI